MDYKLVPIREAIAAPTGNTATNNDCKKYAEDNYSDGKPAFPWRGLICLFYTYVGASSQVIGANWGRCLTCAFRSLVQT